MYTFIAMSCNTTHDWKINLFYSILFYSILFYSILFYSILFYSVLFYSIHTYIHVIIKINILYSLSKTFRTRSTLGDHLKARRIKHKKHRAVAGSWNVVRPHCVWGLTLGGPGACSPFRNFFSLCRHTRIFTLFRVMVLHFFLKKHLNILLHNSFIFL